ncbi:DUF2891 domain-containing protein [Chryseobacterium shandongense]|mgnify:FL=1|uniref:DUF2891 domain-containing protein n=1 Tax=Chryseobacterium shandongense TaxID=1493872 RepID=A0AAD0YBF5_9FLAO|nr:DUF2891 domain-containing protein [Chryseobacterium shandongense]AZA86220.1 DUF2891 domain-containing protein [Chryseobacterium shandongense]AZA94630.1 DUF2891 domain-containing protein [Chryseobacterium shandongense]
MKKSLLVIVFSPFLIFAQEVPKLTDEMAVKLSEKPLHCITQEYPNKTAHIINNADEVPLSPKALHPSFYGCFDWHSSVHGHWMLVRLLKTKPGLSIAKDIENTLDNSFSKENLQVEADYFTKYQLTTTFERTYGWAWLFKLDEELTTWNHPKAKIWHQNLKPLTDKILTAWKTYLPKQTYPNRTGVHPNSAFAMAFAIDWARSAGDKEFENQLVEKAKYFYLKDEKTPAYLEPDGSDFFSPSLEIADLMRRVLPQKEFVQWFDKFYEKRSIENIEKIPVVSDLSDYQTVHLVGLSFSKAWCMKGIAKSLPDRHPLKKEFQKTAAIFLNNGLSLLFQGNYGGDHWLASFAVYALED